MSRTAFAVAAAKASQRRIEPPRLQQAFDDFTFRSVRNGQRGKIGGGIGQFIDMPMNPLVLAEMTPQPGTKATAAVSAPDIDQPS